MKKTIIILIGLILMWVAVCMRDTFKGINLKASYLIIMTSYSVYLTTKADKKKKEKNNA